MPKPKPNNPFTPPTVPGLPFTPGEYRKLKMSAAVDEARAIRAKRDAETGRAGFWVGKSREALAAAERERRGQPAGKYPTDREEGYDDHRRRRFVD
jgi:hypothetical protein